MTSKVFTTNKELQELLKQHPDDLKICIEMHNSDGMTSYASRFNIGAEQPEGYHLLAGFDYLLVKCTFKDWKEK